MPVHIENLTTEVTAIDGELPLSKKQLKQIVQIVLTRLENEQRAEGASIAARGFKTASDGPAPIFKG